MGDWLSINAKFPDGLPAISAACVQAGWVPGIWIAPFVALRSSNLFREHPDWFLKDRQGKPVLAGWNPNWGLEGRFYGLDTTHPEYQTYLKNVIQTIVHAWGFQYLKLDFTYGASLYGTAYDPSLSPAERLKLGYRLIRATAGEDVFLLGCGSPISAAIGLVDAMRIGPDVAPYWFDKLRYHITRDPHALCTRFAIRSTLNRAPFHRQLWLNDPDCLLLRASDTQLSPEERASLLNAIVISGGAFFLSDKLADLSPENWETIATAQQLGAICDRGKTWALDYMENPEPSLVYNSSGYLAVFNFADHITPRRVDLKRYLDGIENLTEITEVWSGKKFGLAQGILDLDVMGAHASYLFNLASLVSRVIPEPGH
jgi:alpha-galactosidase